MVARLQSVISKEIKVQLTEKEGRIILIILLPVLEEAVMPGTIYEYLDNDKVKIVLAEAVVKVLKVVNQQQQYILNCRVLHGCRTLLMQTEDGQITEPYSISAGLDYPGIGPIHANLAIQRRAQVLAINDDEALKAALSYTTKESYPLWNLLTLWLL